MPLMAFVSAVLALLLAPGPTNTLIGVAGAQRGLPYVTRLLPAEMAGYLTAILPLAFFGAGLLERFPAFALGLKLVAAVWVMALALKLWRARPGEEKGGGIGVRRVYLTTLLNPKALIFGLVLLPAPQDPAFAARLGLFCVMVAGVALIWGGAGALTQRAAGSGMRLQRVASVWLALVSLSLALSVMQA